MFPCQRNLNRYFCTIRHRKCKLKTACFSCCFRSIDHIQLFFIDSDLRIDPIFILSLCTAQVYDLILGKSFASGRLDRVICSDGCRRSFRTVFGIITALFSQIYRNGNLCPLGCLKRQWVVSGLAWCLSFIDLFQLFSIRKTQFIYRVRRTVIFASCQVSENLYLGFCKTFSPCTADHMIRHDLIPALCHVCHVAPSGQSDCDFCLFAIRSFKGKCKWPVFIGYLGIIDLIQLLLGKFYVIKRYIVSVLIFPFQLTEFFDLLLCKSRSSGFWLETVCTDHRRRILHIHFCWICPLAPEVNGNRHFRAVFCGKCQRVFPSLSRLFCLIDCFQLAWIIKEYLTARDRRTICMFPRHLGQCFYLFLGKSIASRFADHMIGSQLLFCILIDSIGIPVRTKIYHCEKLFNFNLWFFWKWSIIWK